MAGLCIALFCVNGLCACSGSGNSGGSSLKTDNAMVQESSDKINSADMSDSKGEMADTESTALDGVEAGEGNSVGGQQINTDMLVYRGQMTLSTKDFDGTMSQLDSKIEEYQGFIENSDFHTSSSRYYDDDTTLRHYSATVRVPSGKYDDFTTGVSGIAKVTSRNSNVENLNTEYSDIVTAIDIYKAKEQRYINLLQTVTDDKYALQIENTLTDITVKIAQYESRKKLIETDVAYSYVDITVDEVKEYERQTSYDDTFLVRLKNTIVNTWYDFMAFLEWLLFLIIRISPYALIVLIVYVVLRATGVLKRMKERRAKKRSRRVYVAPPAPDADNTQKTENNSDSQ